LSKIKKEARGMLFKEIVIICLVIMAFLPIALASPPAVSCVGCDDGKTSELLRWHQLLGRLFMPRRVAGLHCKAVPAFGKMIAVENQ